MHVLAVQFEYVVDSLDLDLSQRMFVQRIHVKCSLTLRTTPRTRGRCQKRSHNQPSFKEVCEPRKHESPRVSKDPKPVWGRVSLRLNVSRKLWRASDANHVARGGPMPSAPSFALPGAPADRSSSVGWFGEGRVAAKHRATDEDL